jgi:hypothetical protein
MPDYKGNIGVKMHSSRAVDIKSSGTRALADRSLNWSTTGTVQSETG